MAVCVSASVYDMKCRVRSQQESGRLAATVALAMLVPGDCYWCMVVAVLEEITEKRKQKQLKCKVFTETLSQGSASSWSVCGGTRE